MQTTDIDEIMQQLQVSRETAREISEGRSFENRAALANWPALKAKLKERCDQVYAEALARYQAKNPAGKNGAKSALRKAREVWGGYQR